MRQTFLNSLIITKFTLKFTLKLRKELKIVRCLSCTCFVSRGSNIYFHYVESLDKLLDLENSIKNIVYCSVQVVGTLSSQDEFVDDDERRRVRSGSRTSSKAGKTNVQASSHIGLSPK